MASVAGAIVSAVSNPSKLLEGVSGVINAIRGKDPAAAAELQKIVAEHEQEFRMAELQQQNEALKADVQLAQMQVDVNKADAISTKLIQYGWRPFIGWICGGGLCYQFIIRGFLVWIMSMYCAHYGVKGEDAKLLVSIPELDMGTLLTLLVGMLGLGGMRTYDKLKGTSK